MTLPHAILLSAGQGSRLLPLTLERPKCLIEVGGNTILGHQVEALLDAGVQRISVVAGYRIEQIEDATAAMRARGIDIETIFNPFWAVASSIGSVWAARERMRQPFLLLNGDTIFDPALLAEALGRVGSGVNLLVEPVDEPEEDDMRVVLEEGRVRKVAKGLPLGLARHRSLGVIASCAPDGGEYLAALEAVLRAPQGANRFHHAVVDCIAHSGKVCGIEVGSGFWQEIDRPEDIARWDDLHRLALRA